MPKLDSTACGRCRRVNCQERPQIPTLHPRFLERQTLSPNAQYRCGARGRPIACPNIRIFAVILSPGSLLEGERSGRTGEKREISRPREITSLQAANSRFAGASVSAVVEIGCANGLAPSGARPRPIGKISESAHFDRVDGVAGDSQPKQTRMLSRASLND